VGKAQNTINPNGSGFTVGEWYEDCKGHSFDTFYISGSCTYVQRHHDTSGNEWNTTTVDNIPPGSTATWYDGRFNACFNSSWPQDSQFYPYLVSVTYQVTLSPTPGGFDPNDPPQTMPQENWTPLSKWTVDAPNYWGTPSQYSPTGTIPYPEEYFTPMVDQNSCDQQAPFQWSPGYKNNTSNYQTVTENGQTWQLAPGQTIPPQYTDAQQGNQSLTINSTPQNGYLPDSGTMYISLSNDVPMEYGETNINNPGQFANGQDADQLSQLGVTNSPIIWDNTNTGGGTGGLALDSTLRAGFSAVANLLNQANDYLSRGYGVISNSAGITIVSNFYNPFFTNTVNLSLTNGGGGSNVWVQNWPTNWPFGQTNAITSNDFAAYQQNQAAQAGGNWTNVVLPAISAATNAASALDASAVGQASGFGASVASPSYSGGAQDSSIVIQSPAGTLTYNLGTASLPTAYFTGGSILVWALYALTFLICWVTFRKAVMSVLLTPQATTAGSEIAGTNPIKWTTALTMAGVIVALAAVVTAWAMPHLLSYITVITGNPFAGISGFGWDFCNSFVPMSTLVSCVTVTFFFRMTVDSMAMVFQGVVKFLVGL
jgi:hypothetical protein